MFLGNADSVDYDDLDNYDDNYDAADDDEYRKIGSIRRLFKGFDSDYYKPIKTDASFDGKRNSYIEYKTRGERHENLLPKEYFDMIRPYLRDLINDHKPLMKLTDKANNSDTERGERKIRLVMQNNCISSKNFGETRFIYSASKTIEIFMANDADDIIDQLFDTILQIFQEATETSNERGSEFIHESVASLYYHFQKTVMKTGYSYMKSFKNLRSKCAILNP